MTGANEHRGTGEGPESPADARAVLIGLLVEAAGAARRGASTTGRVLAGGRRVIGAVVGPLWRSVLFAPIRKPTAALLARGAEEWQRLARIGRAEEGRTRDLARHLVQMPVEEVVTVFRDDPKLAALVRAQARALLVELARDPALAHVIRAQGDAYVEHLREHPEPVRELVSEQSTGLAASFVAALRHWNAHNDAVLEGVVRRVLRHRPGARARALPLSGRYAGIASRATAFLIDLVILSAATLVGNWLWDSLLHVFGMDPVRCAAHEGVRPVRWAICQITGWLGLAAAAALPTAYTVLFWAATGQTPGKAVAGVRVVKPDGGRVGVPDSALRLVGYLLSFWALGLGFLSALVDDRRQTWHDKIARTCVVYAWDGEDTS